MSGTHLTIEIEESVLGKNQEQADANRAKFKAAGTLAINLMSSPGSGKTALLEKTLERMAGRIPTAVIVGDVATDNDAKRLSGHGAQTVQITTGGYCHLDASMVQRALDSLSTDGLRLLIVENVGNLVCPAGFDLGEDFKIGLISVAEGEDKPAKYPSLFARVDAVVITKIDMAEIAEWNETAAYAALNSVAPDAPVFKTSSRTGDGLDAWCAWLEERIIAKR
jgi:hydrogenase nickel incorporation protein HypB